MFYWTAHKTIVCIMVLYFTAGCSPRSYDDPEIKVPSKARLEQINSEESKFGQQIRAGNIEGAWRLAIYRLFSSDEEDISESCLILRELIYARTDSVPAVAALVESRLIRSSDIGLFEKQELFQSYIAIEKIPFSFPDTQKALDEASSCLRSKEMSESSKKFADMLMHEVSLEKKVAASSILIIASQLGGKDRAWAERLCREQLVTKSSKKQQQVLLVMYELVTGKSYLVAP